MAVGEGCEVKNNLKSLYEQRKKFIEEANYIKAEEISQKIKEYKNKRFIDKIHFVLFFFLEGSPLQGTQKVLEMFKNENYPVIFVINKSIITSPKK